MKWEAYLYYSWVLFAPLDKLFVCQLRVLVPIHVPEDFVDPLIVARWIENLENKLGGNAHLLGRVLVHRELHHLTSHLVY